MTYVGNGKKDEIIMNAAVEVRTYEIKSKRNEINILKEMSSKNGHCGCTKLIKYKC